MCVFVFGKKGLFIEIFKGMKDVFVEMCLIIGKYVNEVCDVLIVIFEEIVKFLEEKKVAV